MSTTVLAAIETIGSHKELIPNIPPGPITAIPLELIQIILNQTSFSIYDHANCRKVCKLWLSKLTEQEPRCTLQIDPFEVKYVDPHVKIYGKTAWEKYYGYKFEGDIPPPPDNILAIMKSFRARYHGEKKAPSCTLLLMPKGLTLNFLKECVQNPLHGNKTQLTEDSEKIICFTFGNVPLDKSYWVLITNDVFEVSRGKSSTILNITLGVLGEEWRTPKILEAAVCSIMNYVSMGTYVFGKETYTRCQEQVNTCQTMVGNFNEDGLDIYISIPVQAVGLAACQRFGYELDNVTKDQ